MKKIKDDIFGLAVIMQDDYYNSVKEFVEKHIEITKEKEFVYFATDVKIDYQKLKYINKIIFYTSEDIGVFYIGDIIGNSSLKEKSIPTDALSYSPKPYGQFEKNNWLKLKNIKAVDFDDLKKYELLNLYSNNNYIDVKDYILKTKRKQAFYFTAK